MAVCLFLAAAATPPPAHADTFACANDASIRVFADDAGTVSPPIRVLTGAATTITECYGVAVDVENGELWVAHGRVSAFPIGANGNVAPLRSIFGNATGIGFAVSVAVDTVANEVVVGTADGAMLTFPRTGDGNIAATRSLLGASAGVGAIVGLAVDRTHGEMLVTSLSLPKLFAFDRLATGTAVPLRTPTDIGAAGQLVYDPGPDEIYLVNGATILVTNRAGVALRTFVSSGLVSPYGLAMRANGDVLVGDRKTDPTEPDPIYRYAAAPFGNVPPVSTIRDGALPNTVLWGLGTSSTGACSNANVATCLFRDGFEPD